MNHRYSNGMKTRLALNLEYRMYESLPFPPTLLNRTASRILLLT